MRVPEFKTELEVCCWHLSDVPPQSPLVCCWGKNGPGSDGARCGNPLGEIGPESPSGDSGLACDPFGYSGSGLPNGHQWSPQSHLEA